MKGKRISRMLAILLVFMMVFTLIPGTALADVTNFSVSNNSITPAFSTETKAYQLTKDISASTSKLSALWKFSDSMNGKASYTDMNGEAQTVTINNSKNTSLPNIKAGTTEISFRFYASPEQVTAASEYTLSVKRTAGIKNLSVIDNSGNAVQFDNSFSASTYAYSAKVVTGSQISFVPTFYDTNNTVLLVKVGEEEQEQYKAINSENKLTVSNGENKYLLKAQSGDGTTESTVYSLSVEGIESTESTLTVAKDTAVYVYDPSGKEVDISSKKTTIQDNDIYSLDGLMKGEKYSYRVGKYGFFSEGGEFCGGDNISVILEKSTEPQNTIEAEWKNFRNSDTNNGITASATPRNANETQLKWVTEESMNVNISAYQIASGAPMLIVRDYLITTQGSNLVKINKNTGKIDKSQAMDSYNGNLGNSPLVFGGDMIFVPLFNGKVQAFSAETLKPLWISETLGTQCTTALVYDGGYVYGSTGNTSPAAFFCLSASDEDSSNENEIKYATWFISDKVYTKGSYWSMPLIIGDYIIYGTDSGTSGNAAIISRNRKTGELLDECVLKSLGDQRSTLAYNPENSTIYFTSKNATGGLSKVTFDGTNGQLGEVISFKSSTNYKSTTSGPVVYKGTIYFSANAGYSKGKYVIAVDEATFNEKYRVEYPLKTGGGVQSSALLTTAYEESDGSVYFYVTHNGAPGELYVVKDDGKSLAIESLFALTEKYQQANITSAICDKEGTLYYRNDTGYIFALEKNEKATEKRNVSFTVKDISGNIVSGASIEIISAQNDVQKFNADENGVYALAAGAYKYTVKKSGFDDVSGSFTVAESDLAIPIAMKNGSEVSAPEQEDNIITITVKGHDGKANYSAQKLNYSNGMTALSVLQAVVSNLNWKNTEFGAYVVGIDGLEEFDYGNQSGWMYSVNGVFPDYSAGNYILKEGDNVVWSYTTNLGNDIGNIFKPEDQAVTTTGTAGSATTTTPTEVTVSGDTAKATIKTENTSEAIKQAKEKKSAEIVIEVANADIKTAEKVQVEFPTATAKEILNTTTADLTVKTPIGTVTVPQDALKEAVAEAKGTTITIEVAAVSKPTDIQKKAAGTNGQIISVTIKSGSTVISTFGGKSLKLKSEVPAKLKGKNIVAIHIAADGTIEQLAGELIKEGTKEYYEFSTPHLSTFALVDADEIGLEEKDEEANVERIKELVSDMSLKASSSKTSKKNIKVALTVHKDTAAAIKEIEDMGYTVKYKYYRSTRKASKYASKLTSKKTSYTNTAGKKGTKYYYKARVQVYDKDGKLVAQTALKQCRYAARTWSK